MSSHDPPTGADSAPGRDEDQQAPGAAGADDPAAGVPGTAAAGDDASDGTGADAASGTGDDPEPAGDAARDGAYAGAPEPDAPPRRDGALPAGDWKPAGPAAYAQPEARVSKPAPTMLLVGLVAAVGVAAFFAGIYATGAGSDAVTREELRDALSRIELQMLRDGLPTEQPGAMPIQVTPSADDDPVIGDPDAPITIIEFSDFQCPFCAKFHAQTLPALISEYVDTGKAKIVYRDFPLQNIHPNAVPASLAAECANEQGRFKEMHDVLFERQGLWSDLPVPDALITFADYAAAVGGIDLDTFESCMDERKYLEEIRKDLQDGSDYGITGTPGFFVGNDSVGYAKINGAQPFESFERIIEAQLGA